MTALRRGDAKIAEPGLDNHAGPRNLVPLDWNTQPGIVRSPSPNADEQVGAIGIDQLGIEVSYGPSHFLAATAFETVEVHHHSVTKVPDTAVSQHFCALADQLIGFNLLHRQIFLLPRQHQGADLEKAKLR